MAQASPALSHGNGINIRLEKQADAAPRERLLDAAMGRGRKRKSSEAIRRGRLPARGLSLVACGVDGSLVGTVRLWHVQAGTDSDGSPVEALLLGPLAVCPSLKGQGVGGALMAAALSEARRLGHGAVILVGDPEYYSRFGFSAAAAEWLSMPGPFERRRLLALELRPGALRGTAGTLSPSGALRRPAAAGADFARRLAA